MLRGYPFGEADRIVVLLSPNNGKLRIVAKGVRRTKSRFGGRLEPFCHVDLLLYEGRNLDTITQVTLVEPFHALRNDLDAVLVAGSMVEVVDIVAQENESSVRLFLLLQRGLRALDAAASWSRPGHRLPAQGGGGGRGVAGAGPAAPDAAAPTGSPGSASPPAGALCEACRTSGAYALRPGVTAHLSLLAGADLADLPETDPGMRGEGLGVARRFLEYHLERGLGALAVLDG